MMVRSYVQGERITLDRHCLSYLGLTVGHMRLPIGSWFSLSQFVGTLSH
jgi:hypothetical protein